MSKDRKCTASKWQRLVAMLVLLGFIFQPLSAVVFAEEQDTDPPRYSSRSADDVIPPAGPGGDSGDIESERDTDPPRLPGEGEPLPLGASGEEAAPTYTEEIEVATAEELAALASRVNGGDSMKDMLVTLTADIELDPEAFWTPIGNAVTSPFSGTFDGGDHYVSGIRLPKDEEGNYADGGLFGYLYEATIQGVYLKYIDAPNSTGGLYFTAARSTITDCKKQWGPLALFSTRISLFSSLVFDTWDGGMTPVPTSSPVIEIKTAKELAWVADQCMNGTNDFNDKILLLSANLDLENRPWTPIGDGSSYDSSGTGYGPYFPTYPAKTFKGQFYGQGYVIKNLSVNSAAGGLFGGLDAGTTNDGLVTNLVIENADVHSSDSTGIVARASWGASISGVVIKNSDLSATIDAAGICYKLELIDGTGLIEKTASISQCVVMDTDITAGNNASGICDTNENYAVTQCVVYGGSLDAPGATSGILYKNYCATASYAGVTQNVVLGTKFLDGRANGIISDVFEYNAVTNNFISDVELPTTGSYIGTDQTCYGLEYIFTDSQLPNPLVSDVNSDPGPSYPPTPSPTYGKRVEYIKYCFWDSSTADGSRPGLPVNYDNSKAPNLEGTGKDTGHGAYATSRLTSGAWLPNETYWDTEKDFYPYLKYLMTSQTPYARDITGLASVAVLLDDKEQTLDAAKEMRLMKRTASGAPLSWYTGADPDDPASWTPVESSGQFEVENQGDWLVLWSKTDATFNLHAMAAASDTYYGEQKLYKHFSQLTLKDSILEEDWDQRHPNDAEAAVPLATSFLPSRTFLEPVDINDEARGMIRLYTIRDDGEYLDKALACDSANIQIMPVSGGNYQVNFPTLGLRSGMKYRLVIPEGALVEVDALGDPLGNLSREREFLFETESFDTPVLNVPSLIKLQVDSTLSTSDVEGWFGYSNYYDDPAKKQLLTPVTDPKETLSTLPVGLHYYVDQDVLGSSRSPGTWVVHYFAVSSKGQTARATTVIEADGLPQWDPDVLTPGMIHMNWTDQQNSVLALTVGKTRAYYVTARGAKRDVAVEAEINAADWAAAMASLEGPTSVKVTAYMVDVQGNRITSDPKEVLVYMDKVLRYDFNTAPIRIRWEDRTMKEWYELIEEEIAFRALNFYDTADVKYDHGNNTYDENKVYTVKLETAKQAVTLCPGDPSGAHPCSPREHDHLKDQVKLSFTIKIIEADPPEARGFWQKVEDELFVPEYSEFNVTATRKPQLKIPEKEPYIDFDADNFFEMPISIVEALRNQPYHSLELDYSAYKWKLYGHAMEPVHEKQKLFPLKVTREDYKEHLLGRKLDKDIPAVMLRFEYVGEMRGRVEFFYDLRLHGNLSEEAIADTDFYLYRYNRITGKLTPVADVRVEPDGWASMVLTQLENTEYVITDARFGGEKYTRYIGYSSTDDDEPEDLYYHSTGGNTADLSMFETDPPEMEEIDPSLPFASLDTQDMATAAQPDGGSAPTAAGANQNAAPFIAIGAGVLAVAAAIIVIRRRKGKGA